MSLERGLRRIVLLVSVAISIASAAVVGWEIRSVANYQTYRLAHASREESFQRWLVQHPVSEAEVDKRVRAFRDSSMGRFASQYRRPEDLDRNLAAGEIVEELRWEHARRSGVEGFVNPPHPRRPWWDWSASSVVLLGCGAVGALTALPWGVFYLLRWIVKGFLG